MKALILLATLKQPQELSTTRVLSEVVSEKFLQQDIQTEILPLVSYNIPPGTKTDMGNGDQWPEIEKKMFSSDIIIFATPIWWNGQSSLMQRAIERMDELNDKLLETGKTPLINKVGGIIITGAEDGAQHLIGNLSNFLLWNGLTLPPACSVSWLGSRDGKDAAKLKNEYLKDPTNSMAEVMTQNLAFFAKLLKEHPIPERNKGVRDSIIGGAMGFKGNG